jgi:hypothetical protein
VGAVGEREAPGKKTAEKTGSLLFRQLSSFLEKRTLLKIRRIFLPDSGLDVEFSLPLLAPKGPKFEEFFSSLLNGRKRPKRVRKKNAQRFSKGTILFFSLRGKTNSREVA